MTAQIEFPRIYPTFRYRDAAKMIDWLVEAFGFRLAGLRAPVDGLRANARVFAFEAVFLLDAPIGTRVGLRTAGTNREAFHHREEAVFVSVAAFILLRHTRAIFIGEDQPSGRRGGTRLSRVEGQRAKRWRLPAGARRRRG